MFPVEKVRKHKKRIIVTLQRPCAESFRMPKLKNTLRRGLLTKAPTKEVGVLVVPQICFKKVQGLGFFYVKGREHGRGCFCKKSSPSRIPLMITVSKAGVTVSP